MAAAIDTTGVGTAVVARDVSIVDAPAMAVLGFSFTSSAAGDLARIVIENIGGGGILAVGGLGLNLTDVIVRNLAGDQSFGISSVESGTVRARRMVIEGMGAVGISDTGTDLELCDVAIRTAQSIPFSSASTAGGGIVSGGSKITGERLLISGNRGVGWATFGGANTISDLIVRGSESLSDGTGGSGVIIGGNATVAFSRARLENNRRTGLDISGASLTATDLAVVGTRPEAAAGENGRGMVVEDGGIADITRARFEGNHNLAVYAFGVGTRLSLQDARILSTMPSACTTDLCSAGIADGLNAASNAIVDVDRFLVSGNENGLRFSIATLDLREGTITMNKTGLLLDVGVVVPLEVAEHVLFTDNGENVKMQAP
jgi:hypothetical protein